jgi:hypothetical protein
LSSKAINSRNLLKTKYYKIEGDDYSCVLCNLNIEVYTHLLFQCPFSDEWWNFLGIHWNREIYFFDTIKKAKSDCQHDFFMEEFTIAAWEIWKQRNEKIFRGINPSFQSWKTNFFKVKQNMYRLSSGLDQLSPLGAAHPVHCIGSILFLFGSVQSFSTVLIFLSIFNILPQ